MRIQVLMSAMNQTDFSILKRANIKSDAIIVNQCDINRIDEFKYNDHTIKFYSFNERGVGLSRNNALMRADADIIIFADEDIRYEDDYVQSIKNAFANNPKADIILFNVLSKNPERPSFTILKEKKVNKINCLKYGAVRIAARTEKLKMHNINFSLLFGGGSKFSSGEDSLFIFEAISKGMVVYTNPKIIGYVSQQDSSWFNGYTKKFFMDKGTFFYVLSKNWAVILCLWFAIKHRKKYKQNFSFNEALFLMIKGINQVKN